MLWIALKTKTRTLKTIHLWKLWLLLLLWWKGEAAISCSVVGMHFEHFKTSELDIVAIHKAGVQPTGNNPSTNSSLSSLHRHVFSNAPYDVNFVNIFMHSTKAAYLLRYAQDNGKMIQLIQRKEESRQNESSVRGKPSFLLTEYDFGTNLQGLG